MPGPVAVRHVTPFGDREMSKSCRALVVLFVASLVGSAFAESPAVAEKKCDKECQLAKSECKDGECSECPVSKAIAALPKITFAVGEERTCCNEAAKELAKKHDKDIQFVVAEKTYCCQDEAKVALVAATNKFVADFAKPHVCEASGTTTVAGKQLSCSVAATETAKIVNAAMSEVEMAYLVGEKECHCPNEAKALAEKSGEPTVFVVAKEKTQCKVTAELELARQKYIAAVKALAAAEAANQKTEKQS